MVEKIQEYIYRITVELPKNPLRTLNCYVVKGGTRNLLIDTGFNMDECLQELRSGIAALELDMNQTDIFLTHFHADHSGLTARIASEHSQVFMSAIDRVLFDTAVADPNQYWGAAEGLYRLEGYPDKEMQETRLYNPARKYFSKEALPITELLDGDRIHVGDKELICVHTPGHTPGHMCLYDEEGKTMFTGDHLLFGITPNITVWKTLPNSLGAYIDSLKNISEYKVHKALTGHRENTGNFYERIEMLLRHHKERLDDVTAIVENNPGLSGYEVAALMKWSIKSSSWKDFPPGQRWFAVGEAISHLNYLVEQGVIERTPKEGIHTYTRSAASLPFRY